MIQKVISNSNDDSLLNNKKENWNFNLRFLVKEYIYKYYFNYWFTFEDCQKFYNLYDLEDDGLKVNQLENPQPLGLVGTHKLNIPSNYNEENITYEILPFSDADGDDNIEECFEDINPIKVWGG